MTLLPSLLSLGLSRRHLQASPIPPNFFHFRSSSNRPYHGHCIPRQLHCGKGDGGGEWVGDGQDLHGELTDKVLIGKCLQIVSLLIILLITGLYECRAEGVLAPMTRFKQTHS